MTKEQKSSRWRKLVVIVLLFVGLFWFGIALSDQDWLWFLPVFRERASRIYLYREGERIVLLPGDAGYEVVNKALNEILRHVQGREPVRISDRTQEEYYTQLAAVEVLYSEPVIVHTLYGFPKADKYLFPQSGRYQDPPLVFAGSQRRRDYRRGALVLQSRASLDEAVEEVWAAHQND